MHTSGNDVTDMRLGAMQQLRNGRHIQQAEIVQPIHKNLFFLSPTRKGAGPEPEFFPGPYQNPSFKNRRYALKFVRPCVVPRGARTRAGGTAIATGAAS